MACKDKIHTCYILCNIFAKILCLKPLSVAGAAMNSNANKVWTLPLCHNREKRVCHLYRILKEEALIEALIQPMVYPVGCKSYDCNAQTAPLHNGVLLKIGFAACNIKDIGAKIGAIQIFCKPVKLAMAGLYVVVANNAKVVSHKLHNIS